MHVLAVVNPDPFLSDSTAEARDHLPCAVVDLLLPGRVFLVILEAKEVTQHASADDVCDRVIKAVLALIFLDHAGVHGGDCALRRRTNAKNQEFNGQTGDP